MTRSSPAPEGAPDERLLPAGQAADPSHPATPTLLEDGSAALDSKSPRSVRDAELLRLLVTSRSFSAEPALIREGIERSLDLTPGTIEARRQALAVVVETLPGRVVDASSVVDWINSISFYNADLDSFYARKLQQSGAADRAALRKLEQQSKLFMRKLDALSAETTLAIAECDLLGVRMRLSAIVRCCAEAAKALSHAGQDGQPGKAAAGRKARPSVEAIAIVTAAIYCQLTKKKPTAYEGRKSGYFALLRQVFQALGIRANAEYFAKLALTPRRGENGPKIAN